MEHDVTRSTVTTRGVTERALAIVGFLALVAIGISFAIYSSYYLPGAVSRMGGSAAAVLTSLFTPAEPSLSVVPTTPLATPLSNDEVNAPTLSTTTPVVQEWVPPLPRTETNPTTDVPTAGPASTATYPINGTSTAPRTTPILSGLADLEPKIIATGYLTSTSTDSFVATSTVPRGARPAVTFIIKNVGSHTAPAGWRFSAAIPTQNAYVFYSPPQQALNPGDSIEYILGFDQASPGSGRSISIVANSDRTLGESNTANNSATATVTILGS